MELLVTCKHQEHRNQDHAVHSSKSQSVRNVHTRLTGLSLYYVPINSPNSQPTSRIPIDKINMLMHLNDSQIIYKICSYKSKDQEKTSVLPTNMDASMGQHSVQSERQICL